MSTQPTQPVEPGYTTTEFWLTFLTAAGAGATLVFHKDFSGVVQVVAVAAAAVGQAVYAVARTFRKHAASSAAANPFTRTS